MVIDTHCHLDFKDFDHDRDEVIKRARANGVGIIVNVGSSLEGSRRAVELAKRYDFIYAAVGIHPHDAEKLDKKDFDELEGLALSEKVVAIGEVGLDYYRNLSSQDSQKKTFHEFIGLSKKLNLPLILHSRSSHKDMLNILKEAFSAGCGAGASGKEGRLKGVMHCFSGDENFLKECLAMDLYISFTGNLTFKNADSLRAVAKQVPIEKILLETDAPFLAPQEHRGKRNEPAYIVYLVKEISKIHGLSSADIEHI
ncbi:MAG: TatD family hydrolase, partial [Candidatus Omnitrophica bacterium]|nr:TatD family hydrolase [Candidatus Omnitrophota bacterium]